MLREMRLATVILIVLTVVVVVLAVNQTTVGGFLASGVTEDVALSWGQNSALANDGHGEATEEQDTGAEGEATEEATQETSE